MKRKLQTALIVAVAVAAGIGGYLANRNPTTTTTQTREVPLETVNALLALRLADTEGQLQALEQWRGKVIVANFWATWCPPCRKEIPDFAAASQSLAGEPVQFIGLSIDSADKVIEMMMAGATAVQVGAANLVDPYASKDIIEALPAAMQRYGIARLSDIVGAALA